MTAEFKIQRGDIIIYYSAKLGEYFQIRLSYGGNNYFHALSVAKQIDLYNPLITPDQSIIDQYFQEDFTRLNPSELVNMCNLYTRQHIYDIVNIDEDFFADDIDRSPICKCMCGSYLPECLFSDFINYLESYYGRVCYYLEDIKFFTFKNWVSIEDEEDYDDGFIQSQL